jgi:serine/threonine protein phosphatase PrpC
MAVTWAALTDPGLRRSENEDSYCVRVALGLFVVADGMGGHAAGEVASRVVVDELQTFVEATTQMGPQDTCPTPLDGELSRDGNRLKAGLHLGNRRIGSRIEENNDLHGMATTAVAALVTNDQLALAHVGDSRAYLWRAGTLSRLTRDHSWVEEQIDAGMLSVAAAREHPWRSIVTRALSGNDGLEVEVAQFALEARDRVLLCSDGLSSVLPDEEIAGVMAAGTALDAVCEELVKRTNAGGGPDNVTTLLLQVDAD